MCYTDMLRFKQTIGLIGGRECGRLFLFKLKDFRGEHLASPRRKLFSPILTNKNQIKTKPITVG